MMRRLTKEQIKKVKELDILTFFKNYRPDDLVRMGRNDSYCLKSHRSIKISNGLWCWWSHEGIGGRTALDYLIKVESYEFKEACYYLLDLMDQMPPVKAITRQRRNSGLLIPKRNDSNSEVYFYLTTERGLDPDLVCDLMKEGLIFEEAGSHNAVFLGLNERKGPAYAFKRSIHNDTKMEAAGSSKAYSFRLENPESEDLRVFEGAIDLLSFITLLKMTNHEWRNAGYLSLGGVNGKEDIPVALINYLERCPKTKNIYMHFDTDQAGVDAAVNLTRLMKEPYQVFDKNLSYYNDINEQLIDARKGEKIICRNLW